MFAFHSDTGLLIIRVMTLWCVTFKCAVFLSAPFTNISRNFEYGYLFTEVEKPRPVICGLHFHRSPNVGRLFSCRLWRSSVFSHGSVRPQRFQER